MLEKIRTQLRDVEIVRISQPTCEVSHFMKNFFEATYEGNLEEAATYFADDIEPVKFPVRAIWTDERLIVDDHLATFTCYLKTNAGIKTRLTCVLDKSEGYWQIIHAQVRDESMRH